MSCPRSATRTGCEESGETRYWYHEMSQANVSTISALTPESGVIEACGSPSAFATPAIVRRNCVALKSSAASTRAISSSPRRRRIGSLTTGSTSSSRAPRSDCQSDRCRRRRTGCCSIGESATPSLTQPWSTAVFVQSGHTSTYLVPSGEYRSACSPCNSVRSQTTQVRVAVVLITRMDEPV